MSRGQSTSFVLVIVRNRSSEVRVVDRGMGTMGRTVGALVNVCPGEVGSGKWVEIRIRRMWDCCEEASLHVTVSVVC
jgi:hypothetical protein